jgi:hypothetical protein
MKALRFFAVFILVMALTSAAHAQRTYKQWVSASNIAGVKSLLTDNMIDGDLVKVKFWGDATYGYNEFHWALDADSTATEDEPTIIAPTTGSGRWLLVFATEWT